MFWTSFLQEIPRGSWLLILVLAANGFAAGLLFSAMRRILKKKQGAIGVLLAYLALVPAGTLLLLNRILLTDGHYQNPGLKGAFALGGLISGPLIICLVFNTWTKIRQLLKRQ
ncbi:MAG: hypothetical protein VB070_14490 [Clostridiaceae bacterium]|nr:hypothetical protein [Clostridiaceae bacterium]